MQNRERTWGSGSVSNSIVYTSRRTEFEPTELFKKLVWPAEGGNVDSRGSLASQSNLNVGSWLGETRRCHNNGHWMSSCFCAHERTPHTHAHTDTQSNNTHTQGEREYVSKLSPELGTVTGKNPFLALSCLPPSPRGIEPGPVHSLF